MKLFIGPAGDCAATKGKGAAASFAHLERIGLNAQELEFVQQVYLKHDAAVEVGKAAVARGVHVSIHAPYYINLCTLDAEKLAASKKRIADSLDRAEALQAPGPIAVHPGFFQGQDKQVCFDAVVDACVELSEKFPKALLGLETTGKHSAFGSFKEVLEVCKASKRRNVVPVVDFAHVYARNNGKIDFGAVLDEFLSYGHRELYSHFSGIAFGEKGEKNHLPVSSNSPPFEELARELKKRESKFSKVAVVCESPLLEQDALVLKKIAEKNGFSLAPYSI